MIKKLFSSQLRINMVSGTVVTVINIAVLAVAYPVYLRFLGYELYGIWLVLSTVLSFAQLGNLGVGQAVMKLVAEEYGRNNLVAVQQYVGSAIVILIFSGIIPLISIIVFRSSIISLFKLSSENAEIALHLLPYIGCLSLYVLVVQALNATLSGLGRMDMANYAQVSGRIAMVCVATFLLYRGGGIESLFVGSIVSYGIIHAASFFLIRRTADIRLLRWSNLSLSRVKRLLSFGSGVFGGSVIKMLLSPFNKLMLSRYVGVGSIPIYEIAYNASMQVRCVAEAGLRALMPEISRIGAEISQTARDRVSRLNQKANKLIYVAGIPIYSLLILLAAPLFQIWLGERYNDSLPGIFRLMAVGSFMNLLGVPAFYTALGWGMSRSVFFAHLVQSGANILIVLGILLLGIPISLTVIAWSIMFSMGAATCYLLWEKHRLLAPSLLSAPVGSDRHRLTQEEMVLDR